MIQTQSFKDQVHVNFKILQDNSIISEVWEFYVIINFRKKEWILFSNIVLSPIYLRGSKKLHVVSLEP